jgi:hypothetical protein
VFRQGEGRSFSLDMHSADALHLLRLTLDTPSHEELRWRAARVVEKRYRSSRSTKWLTRLPCRDCHCIQNALFSGLPGLNRWS